MPKKPSPAKARRAPKASRRKVFVHTFYLLQPVVQFFALIAVLLIFARCSPLASSTDRNGPATSASHEAASAQAAAAAEEHDINASLKELSAGEMAVVSDSEMDKAAGNTPRAEAPLDESSVKKIFQRRNGGPILSVSSRAKVLLLALNQEQQIALFRDHQLRLSLKDLLAASGEKPRRVLFQNLQRANEDHDLGARAFLSLPDATMQRARSEFEELKLPLSISLAVLDEERAFLQLTLGADALQSQDNATLLASALQEGAQLAILLE